MLKIKISKIKKYIKNNNFKFGLLLVFLTWGIYFLQLWTKMIYFEDGSIYAGWYKLWADWSAHYTYASVFKFRNIYDWFLVNPLHITSKFTYPFLVDAITGLLWKSGFSSVNAFLIANTVFTFLMLFSMYLFFYTFLKSALRSFLAITFVMFSGGLGFFYYFQNYFLQPLPLLSSLEFTNLRDKGIGFINILTTELVPQRAFILGLAITFLALTLLHQVYLKKWNKKIAIAFVLAVLGNLLFITHIHSLIVLIIISAVYFIYDLKNYRFYLYYIFFSLLFLIPLYFFFLYGNLREGFFSVMLGWLSNKKSLNVNFIWFWILNWGAVIPLFSILFFYYKLYKIPIYTGAIVVFVISNIILFQPHDWDNSKLFTYVYVICIIPIAKFLIDIFKQNIFSKILSVFLLFFLTFSGFLDVFRLSTQQELKVNWFSREDLLCAAKINSLIYPGDVILTNSNHNNIIPTNTKAQIISGYDGWLWTYGIDYTKTSSDINNFYNGVDREVIIKKYNVKYLAIYNYDYIQYKIPPDSFNKYRKILNCDNLTVYSN